MVEERRTKKKRKDRGQMEKESEDIKDFLS